MLYLRYIAGMNYSPPILECLELSVLTLSVLFEQLILTIVMQPVAGILRKWVNCINSFCSMVVQLDTNTYN
jgi:hypothetical protein